MLRLAVALALGLVTASLPARATECAAAAKLDGDDELARRVAGELSARGVSPTASPGCIALHARVSGADGAVVVDVLDVSGRHVERRTASTASAATFIESWARSELTDDLFERRAAPPPAAPERPMPFVAVIGESALGTDGSVWTGVSLTGCAWLGPACVGANLRLARDQGWSGDSHRVGGHRSDYDVLITAELPARGPRLVVAPGVGAGFGWLRSHSPDGDGQRVSLDWENVRAEAHLRIATPLWGGIWFTATASAAVLPLASTDIVFHDGAMLAAEPRAFFRFGIGLSSSEAP
jgi:hypothetical protein